MAEAANVAIVELAADIVSAYIQNNSLKLTEVANLIADVHRALTQVATGVTEKPTKATAPAVSVKRSVQGDFIVCLEDGRKFKSLKRHLRTRYNMSPEEYRTKWNLPKDYPMVAPNYAAARSELAKAIGLGQQRRKSAGAAPSSTSVKRGRNAKAGS